MTVVVLPDPAIQPTIDVPAAADLLGVNTDTAYNAIKAGEFPVRTFRVGRRIRVVTADLLRFLELTQSEPESPARRHRAS
jgi:excisionase family DNA binding protein